MPLLAATAYPPGFGPWSLNVSLETLVVAEMASLGVAYLAALRLLGPRYVEPGERPATLGQVSCFVAALVCLGFSEGWPLAGIANDYLFSAHMLQHLIFVLVVPPLLLLGTPHWLARALLKRSVIWPLMKKLTRPIPATIIFNAVVIASHSPQAINLAVHNQVAHILDHVLLLGAGLIMWFPVLSPLPELPRLSYPAQMLYLFLQTILPTIPASFLTFASKPLYHYYASLPRAFGLSALADTQISGLLMKVGMGLELWTIIAVIFFRWSSQEERTARPPNELEWQAVERELNRTEPKST